MLTSRDICGNLLRQLWKFIKIACSVFSFFTPAVKEIWLASSDDNKGGDLIGRIGPYMITTNSVKCMESTLSDEVNTFFFSFFLSIKQEPSG